MAKKQYQPPQPPKPPAKEVIVTLPQSEFPVNIYANTFGIELVGENRLLHFGFLINPGRYMGSWACMWDSKSLEMNKESWLKYLNEVGYPETEEAFQFRSPPPSTLGAIPYSNLIALARTGETAEIRIFSFAFGDVVEDRRSLHTGKVAAQGVAIVRCPLDMQRHLIIALYGDPAR